MVGELVMDRFRLVERIGSGGMGTVYRAFDERLQRHVAVKEVMVGDPDRITREAQAAARLNHPGIVTLFEMGTEGHRALLVSELVAGSTLDELARDGDLCDRDVAELGSDICEALAHAHANGVVHRDVKPQNVIARDDAGAGRRAKLMDFGIASLAGSPTLTATGEVVGTLAYMSPEQAEGEVAGPQSDTYSLALALYECWAGGNPARRATPAQTARELGEPLPSLAVERPDLPPTLTATIDACLDPNPERRLSLTELRAALEAAIPALDNQYAVPSPLHAPEPSRASWRPDLGRVAAAAAVLLATPVVVWLGALPATAALPAAAAAIGRTAASRAVLGALGWCLLLAGCSALNLEPPAGLEGVPVSQLAEPAALLGMAAFAVAATSLGWALAARHAAIALLGSVLWAAGLAAALSQVGDGGLGEAPLVIAAGALAAVVAEFARRSPAPRFSGRDAPASAPVPGVGGHAPPAPSA
jgi:eukaryotic-like serine/threonine-protein kinase